MKSIVTDSPQALRAAVQELGFLPFFKNEIKGFSIEEMCPPRLWFSDDPGPWEWKGPVIRQLDCAYGKFFRGKAVYVSLEWFPRLCNYRRDGYDFDARCDDGLVFFRDAEIYSVIQSAGKISSKLIREKAGADADKYLSRLQMQTYIVNSDFLYGTDKNGKPYGWGIAEFCTPEYLYGDVVRSRYGERPSESYEAIFTHVKSLFKNCDEKALGRLLK